MSLQSSLRILVADDLAEWRAQVREILRGRPKWQIIGEACDGLEVVEACNGLEAVQKTIELHPDVVLLDINMPCLNGIEAAKIMLQRCPESKILFLTQDGDPDIRNAAMQFGAAGYVLKANAAHELLEAIATAGRNP